MADVRRLMITRTCARSAVCFALDVLVLIAFANMFVPVLTVLTLLEESLNGENVITAYCLNIIITV